MPGTAVITCMIEDFVFCKFVEDNLAVMSVGFLLGSPDDAVIWRGPKKNGRWKLLYYFNIQKAVMDSRFIHRGLS